MSRKATPCDKIQGTASKFPQSEDSQEELSHGDMRL
jgi:hypothetical protein